MKIPSPPVSLLSEMVGWSRGSLNRGLARLLVVGLLFGTLGGPARSSPLSAPNVSPVKETATGAPTPGRAPKRKGAQDVVPTGQLVTQGAVYLNEVAVPSGTTVFSNTLIRVSGEPGSQAIVNLGPLGTIELASGAQMVVRFGNGLISGELLSGDALVRAPAGVRISISTPDGMVQSSGAEATELPLRTSSGTRIYEVEGRPTVNPAGTSTPGAGLTAIRIAALMLGIAGVVAVTSISPTLPVVSPFTP